MGDSAPFQECESNKIILSHNHLDEANEYDTVSDVQLCCSKKQALMLRSAVSQIDDRVKNEADFVHIGHFSSMLIGLFSGRCMISPLVRQKSCTLSNIVIGCTRDRSVGRPL